MSSQQKINHQRGVALVVVMLLLVAITGITLWMVKQSTLSEGLARNQQDQEAARQAAESAPVSYTHLTLPTIYSV
mgnify:CR=1 FL=1